MRSPWLIVLFLCLSASVNAIVPLPGSDDIQLGFNTFNVTHQRAATHFIMSGYQTTSFRSEDCDIKINGQDAPFQYVLHINHATVIFVINLTSGRDITH
jgi:predicted Zn-dependent protease